jgi:hypothetical protein
MRFVLSFTHPVIHSSAENMDDIFPILMFIIFFLAPLLEGIKRKRKGDQEQPPPRRPLPRPQQQRLPPQRRETPAPSRMEEVSGKPRAEESAAAMVPDDLWEILTGQKRPPVLTTPPQTPERRPHWDVVFDPEAEAEDVAEEAASREDVNVEVRRARVEAQSLETYDRHPQPVVISLEENLPTAAQRHDAFHKKIAATAPVAKAEKRPLLDLHDRSELQRAFLLQEVFGKPRGLD